MNNHNSRHASSLDKNGIKYDFKPESKAAFEKKLSDFLDFSRLN